jgi:hypothetical protein
MESEEDETWDHLPQPPTPDPPAAQPTLEPPTLEPPTLEPPTLEPPTLDPPTLEPPTLAPSTEPMLEPTFDPLAPESTTDPPPPSEPLLERDRLLAAYLAERTPMPSSRFPAPSSHLLGDAARRARATIPREEPAEETLEQSPPTDREGRP